jgi:hypothetical protein
MSLRIRSPLCAVVRSSLYSHKAVTHTFRPLRFTALPHARVSARTMTGLAGMFSNRYQFDDIPDQRGKTSIVTGMLSKCRRRLSSPDMCVAYSPYYLRWHLWHRRIDSRRTGDSRSKGHHRRSNRGPRKGHRRQHQRKDPTKQYRLPQIPLW